MNANTCTKKQQRLLCAFCPQKRNKYINLPPLSFTFHLIVKTPKYFLCLHKVSVPLSGLKMHMSAHAKKSLPL